MESERRPTYAMIFSKEDGTQGICFAEAEAATAGPDGIDLFFRVVEGQIPAGKFEGEVLELLTPGKGNSIPPSY